ncbi:hypothetical protein dsx2_3128 [Desulfovibrio sp. X2]|uniref:hypothetical protein n=1 Tax=Desulfovibrio sp. X2 TaxID=941449 RepID=UPI000358DAEE|nr:hypothetical protein [Desulfovibrio sp. X2]EPR41609.1 hypothetical protein dsx2_3128 [Desulfovibrio sp. X2]
MSRLDEILDRMEALERELAEELSAGQSRLAYTFRKGKVRFEREVRQRHAKLAAKWSDYVYESGVLIILTVPIIWGALLPAVLLDAVVFVYQLVCFPIYGIPRVKRREHIVIDRQALGYLNLIEKLNCMYCGYFNGLMSYVREVAARTEQYWCPVRHARPPKSMHGRYRYFFDYGDAEAYRKGLSEVRRRFGDLRGEGK